ncbi:MAG: hypothetical protein DLM65_08485 [Candidatus Aeolococcus gillhamiae]|uniref:DUF3987 domain-containing protein n=1 Tax=Candidatus Aeolococcus gillhamiae TaxID=3127015 RepID=A0A2W5ZBW4_9BACT|nr:MAG: hypothetical protein DLM65_08485 [Candidatus Dormibacter sp. RRmetagenome_bin12]
MARHVVATYPYHAADRRLLYDVLRFDPKEFMPRHPDPETGAMVTGLAGVEERVPYRLPELLAESGRVIFWVEGEKAADRLVALGLLATTTAGGAKSFAKHAIAYAEHVHGRRVVILPDHDPDGRTYGASVASALAAVDCDVRLVDLPELPPKGDVSDWLDAGHGIAELNRLVASAPTWPVTQAFAPTAPEEKAAVTAHPASEIWHKVIPLDDRYRRAPFPVHALPGWLAEWVQAIAAATQTPADLAAMFGLAVVSAAAGRCIVVELMPEWREPVNLYIVMVAESGERKTAVCAEATAPLTAWEEAEVTKGYPAHQEARARRDIACKRAERAADQASKEDDPVKRAKASDVAVATAQEAANIVLPPLHRLMADDVTPEALTGLLAAHGGRLALLSAEGGFFGMLSGRYSRGVPNLDVVLKAHSSETIRVDRKTRAPEYVERPAITLGLAVQPDVVNATRSVPELRERGFLARCLFSVPSSNVGRRSTEAPSVPTAVKEAYATGVRALAEQCIDHVDAPRRLTLSDAAADLFRGFRKQIEMKLLEPAELGHLRDWGSKLPGAVARIAGLFHVAGGALGDRMEESTVADAIAVGEYLIAHALVAFGLMRADPNLVAARRVLAQLQHKQRRDVTIRELFSELPRPQFPRVDDLSIPLAILEEHGYVRRAAMEERAGPGRKPSPRFEIHPDMSAESAQPGPKGNSAESADAFAQYQKAYAGMPVTVADDVAVYSA